MSKRLNLRPALFVGSLLFVFFFQNCSQPQNAAVDQAAYNDTLPFAYKAQIDTLAYMSCSNLTASGFEPRAYFTFRAGAYSNLKGGLSITPSFYQQTQYFSNTDRANTLSQSQFNSNTTLNLSLRASSNYQSLYYVNQVAWQRSIDQFLPELDSPQIAGPLASLQPGVMANYFPGPDNTQRFMEASLRFMDDEPNANKIRMQLGGNTLIMVAGYPQSVANNTDPGLKSPLDVQGIGTSTTNYVSNATQVFGVGYKLGFQVPYGNHSGDNRVIATYRNNNDIQEIDLTSNTTISSAWDCDPSFQFQIVRPEDLDPNNQAVNAARNPSLCLLQADPPNSSDPALLAVRRVLRAEDWYVDVAHHCVVPRYGGDICYGSSLTNNEKIQYSLTSCADVPGTSVCPHMVSVCIRN